MIKKYLFISILLISLISCTKLKNNIRYSIIENFQDTVTLAGTFMELQDVQIGNPCILDSLLLSTLFQNNDYFLRVYNLNTGQLMGDLLSRGRAENEVTLPMLLMQSPVLRDGDISIWVKDFPRKIFQLNITQSLKRGKTIIEKEYNFVRPGKINRLYESNSVFVLDTGIFLMNISQDRGRNADNNSETPFYVIYDYSKDKVLDTLSYRYPLEIRQSFSKSQQTVISYSFVEDIISLYNIRNKEELVLMHTQKQPEEVYTVTNPQGKMPVFTYLRCETAGDKLFALYGRNGIESPRIPGEACNIHVFNFQGDALYNLVIQEEIVLFCVDARSENLYGMDTEDRLYVYDLKEVLKRK